MLKFTKEHEWIRVEGDIATIGITQYAQEQLGDLVFVEVSALGKAVEQGGMAAVVESVKAASDVYAPITGTVTEANQRVIEDPALVNADPQGNGWLFRMTVGRPAEIESLLDEAAYAALVN
jgi:glycine cleavage system H protein